MEAISNDYQGQTVIELDTGRHVNHLPSSASRGHGFCWASINPSPTGKLVAVEGCYWACPYELRFYDFSEPMLPPWPVVGSEHELIEFVGWIDDERAHIGGEEHFHETLKMTRPELYNARKQGTITEDQYERYSGDDGGWQDRVVDRREWVRPSMLQSLQTFLDDFLSLPYKRQEPVHADLITDLKSLLERLTDSERAAFNASELKATAEWALANEANAAG